jgi:NAD-dependent deacetylase
MKKKVLIFTGAGVSAESGVETFRTDENGLWYKHKVEDVATFDGWRRDREKVLNFYNDFYLSIYKLLTLVDTFFN